MRRGMFVVGLLLLESAVFSETNDFPNRASPSFYKRIALAQLLCETNSLHVSVLQMSTLALESRSGLGDGVPACRARLPLLGFMPAKCMMNVYGSDLDASNIVFVANKISGSSYIFDGPGRNCGGTSDRMFLPRLPKEGGEVFGVFYIMSQKEIDDFSNAARHLLPFADCMNDVVERVENNHTHSGSCARLLCLRYNPYCIFEICDTPFDAGELPIGNPVQISRREASEMLYVLLGGEKYAERRKAATWLIPAEEMSELSTELGKSLQFYKTHEDERKKLFEEVRRMRDCRAVGK